MRGLMLRHLCRFSGRAWGRLPSPLAALLGSNTGGKCVTKTQMVARDRTCNANSLEKKKKHIGSHPEKLRGQGLQAQLDPGVQMLS